MEPIQANPRFADAYRKLADVTLNPRRHTAANALAHSEMVARHAGMLARANGCSDAETRLLEDLGRAHDIGKITGTAKPERSLGVLAECGIDDPALLALVKVHDTNLPWYLSAQRGQAPTDKAWRRIAKDVDLKLLALFMVADRVDAPPGWRKNAPIVWFLEQARQRASLGELVLDLPGVPSTISAGGAWLHDGRVLVIRVRADHFELPKGGIEWDELPADAAARETREEAGASGELVTGDELGHVDYAHAGYTKRVRYFRIAGSPALGPLPARTHERRWVDRETLATLPFVSDAARTIALRAFS